MNSDVEDLPEDAAEPQQPAATDAAFLKCEHGDDGVAGDSPRAESKENLSVKR